MGPGVKEDKTVPKGQSQFFKLSIMFFILNISNFVVPVTAFSLRTCHISHNKALCNKVNLKAVPRDIPPTVQGLDLSLNKISRIQQSDFKNLVLLTELDLKGNGILEIASGAFADLISLNKLNLNSNKLVKLGEDLFDGLSNLTELRIHRNGIKVVAPSAFKSLTSLTFLDMSYNKLDHLTKVNSLLQHLPNLRYLSIQNNNLGTFRSWELTNSSLQLNSFDVSQNPIAVFAITANVFPNLTLLSVGNGTQEMTWEVFNKTFLSQVSTLDISGLKMKFHDMKKLLENVNSSLTSLRMNAMTHDLAALTNITCTIPTLSKLQLRDNKLKFLHSDLFQSCSNITELDIAENKMLNIQDEAFRAVQGLRILDLSRNRLSSVPVAIRNLMSLEELNLSSNNISILGCHEFANLAQLRDLSLYLNSISALNACVFKGLIQLKVLKLQNNHISNLGGAFKKYLPNLRQLQLDENKLTTIKYMEFKGLRSLQLLSLHDNQIQKLENGCFSGLISLTDIKLQSNKIGKKDITNGCLKDLIKLTRLDLRNNHIQFISNSPLSDPPFSKLSRLEILEIPSQHHRGKSHLPSNFLQGLTKLLKLNIRNIQLLSLPKGMFNYTPRLEELDISSNDLVDLSPDLFFPIRGLKSLYISRTSLRSLDFLIDAGLTKVEFLQSRKNEYSVISEEVMKSLPALVYVDLKGNSFTCDCDNSWFLQWAENNNHTQVFDAYNFECNYPPDLKGMRLLDLDVQSCTVNIDFICFVTTTCIILLFMVMSFTYHFLRWHLAYAYYFFLAYLFDSKHKNKQAPNQYDAFISYNYHDEPWVMRELLPKLEGEQGWKLCLHHRDFEPGKFIIDNITDAIYGSRKTICVISHKYLESEWCSREIQVASFRLFDEMKDMLILVFLEDIPIHQLSPYYRMRKLLKKQTYLSWPQARGNTEVFWKKLHQALTTRRDESPKHRFCTTLVDRP